MNIGRAKIFLMLKKCKNVGLAKLNKITKKEMLSLKSVDDIYQFYLDKLFVKGGNLTKDEFKLYEEEVENLLQKNKDKNIVVIAKFDRDYPKQLYKIARPPVVLFVRGSKSVLQRPGIAIVGTREIFDDAQKIGEQLGEIVAAQYGYSVISGLAAGCDTAGHTGCLKGNGCTIAFVPTSIDKVYPKANKELAEKIVENGGSVVSEYPIGTQMTTSHFIERDRLQCGLARGTIVVATGLRDGTWHAINGTLAEKKPLACVGYSEKVYSEYPQTLGNKQLIDEKRAVALVDKISFSNFMKRCNSGLVRDAMPSKKDDPITYSLFDWQKR